MSPLKKCLILFICICCFIFVQGTDFDIVNQCPYTVWAAASPGGGKRLETGERWPVKVQLGTDKARIWGRTGCNFDANGKGKCDTGDCNGMLECQDLGAPPNMVAELIPSANNLDFIDMSVINGFNVPMEFSPVGAPCKTIKCNADIIGQCPEKLRTKGRCNNACVVFKTAQYCCPVATMCGPNEYSKFFKKSCPDTYTYPNDDQTGLVTCPSGTNYRIVFCP